MSKYFTIGELTASAEARRRGIDNTPPPDALTRMRSLIDNLLDPIRRMWGAPIRVNSGYRCPDLNRAVGGSLTSQHMKGEAADITAGSAAQNRRLFEMIAGSGLAFDQLIDEKNYAWIHISYRAENNRQKILHL